MESSATPQTGESPTMLELRLYDGFPFKHLLPENDDPLRPPPELTQDPYLNKSTPEYRIRAEAILKDMELRLQRLTQIYELGKEKYILYLEKMEEAQWNMNYLSPSYRIADRPSTVGPGGLVSIEELYHLQCYIKDLKLLTNEAGRELQHYRKQIEELTRDVAAAAREMLRLNLEPTYNRFRSYWKDALLENIDNENFENWSDYNSDSSSSCCSGCVPNRRGPDPVSGSNPNSSPSYGSVSGSYPLGCCHNQPNLPGIGSNINPTANFDIGSVDVQSAGPTIDSVAVTGFDNAKISNANLVTAASSNCTTVIGTSGGPDSSIHTDCSRMRV